MRARLNSSSHLSCTFDIHIWILYNGFVEPTAHNGVRLKRRLPVIPQVRNGGVCIALAGNLSRGGDTYYFDIFDCSWSHWLHCEHNVSRAVLAR